MRLWDDEIEAARDKIRAEAKDFVAGFPDAKDVTGTPIERAKAKRAAEAKWVFRSDKGVDRTIPGPSGPLRLREFRRDEPEAVMIHFHGGGWMTGTPEMTDLLNEALSDQLNISVVSVDYRLAPEHPYPAGPDDCEAAAVWLVENAAGEYGADKLLIGGESAGAHLSVVTLLRMRDRHSAADRFCGANLVFGAYDFGHHPSASGVGIEPGSDVLETEEMRFMMEQFTHGMSDEDRYNPDISPAYADLRGLPPALFLVGTNDHLLDDTLLLSAKWSIAGNRAELLVYPDAPHGCIGVPTVLAHWWPRLVDFLRGCVEKAE
jgi:acetyl esterase